MGRNSAAEQREDELRSLAEQVLPTLNFAVLLIPVIAVAMQLGSAAAGFVAATSPTDVAELDTPVQTRTQAATQRSSVDDPRPATPDPRPSPSAPLRMHDDPIGDRSLADPLLGYGI